MRIGFYLQLAIDSIRKNKRLYIPYILTGSIMVMMFYILRFLRTIPVVLQMRGGSVLSALLPMCSMIIAFFSLLFLFYTNSFLMRQRNREFGLYNVLGMDKKNLSKIIICENLIISFLTILFGIVIGILFSKLSELVLLNLLQINITYTLNISLEPIVETIKIYALVYLLLTINSIFKIHKLNSIELIMSNKSGEKAPKANWLLAILGIICLGGGYYIAIAVKDNPLEVLSIFIVAVMLVIAGIYMIFIAGSVAYLKILKKNKKYYYNPKHYVSIASMIYRMKRNGAGLASICILLTMVLVMISSTASLYISAESILKREYPSDIGFIFNTVGIENFDDETLDNIAQNTREITEKYVNEYEFSNFKVASIQAYTKDGIFDTLIDEKDEEFIVNFSDITLINVIGLDDYNKLANESETLDKGECLIYSNRQNYNLDTVEINNTKFYDVKKQLDSFIFGHKLGLNPMFNTLNIITENIEDFYEKLKNTYTSVDSLFNLNLSFECGIDAKLSKDMENNIKHELADLSKTSYSDKIGSFFAYSKQEERASYLDIFGSLLFIGIMLSVVFLFANILIMYYKQISEGFEDQDRFKIMQNIGMTKDDIKKSVNSQIMSVFFLPIIFAALNQIFALPILIKIMKLFNMYDYILVIKVTAVCFVILALAYVLVYKATAMEYFKIVSFDKSKNN